MATINEILDKFEQDYMPKLAPSTQKGYKDHIKMLRREFGEFEPDKMKPKDFGPFLNVPKGKIVRNRCLAVLSCALGEAVGRWYMADRNVLRDVKRNASHHRDRYISDVEFTAVRALAPMRVKIAMDLALLTGQRQGDLLRLPWSNVTTDGIYFRQGKTGKRLLVKLSPAIEEVLTRAAALTPDVGNDGNVIHTQYGTPYVPEGFRACWQKVMNTAMRLKAIDQRFTFHDIRGKSASDAASVDEAYQRLGHQDISITRQIYDRGIRAVDPLR